MAADLAIVGGGILGLAAARAWLLAHPGDRVVVLEKEPRLAAHQTGHNSGVLHSGLYYAPGTRKAATCRRGKALLEAWCSARGVPFRRVGKLVVATDLSELGRLADLEARGRAHGVELHRLEGDALREVEPAAGGLAALHLPETGIVDYRRVAAGLGDEVREAGGELRLGCEVTGIEAQVARDGAPEDPGGAELRLADGGTLTARRVLACAGLQADRIARAGGLDPDRPSAEAPALRTVPFLGQYHDLVPAWAERVRGLIYPVPDPSLPFLGVHLTRRMPTAGAPTGTVDAGPSAVLTLARERYAGRRPDVRDAASALTWPGTWRLVRRHARHAASEVLGSVSRASFARRAARLLPGLTADDLVPREPGIRAQALGRDGSLVDDYALARRGPVLHLLNAPSPAATSCLAIADELVALLERPA